jgi:hypothetical protein
MFDVSDQDGPVLVAGYNTPGAAISISLTNDHMFIADYSSLMILEYRLTDIEGITNPPARFSIGQNYPNPFNSATTFQYGLPLSSHVTIEIYDIQGRKIETLINENQNAGFHKIDWDATDYASGIYFYKIETDNFNESKRMLLLK